jgi:hypothetical protein
VLFGVSLVLLMLSLFLSVIEIRMSILALDLHWGIWRRRASDRRREGRRPLVAAAFRVAMRLPSNSPSAARTLV